jgi:serine/threonine-protein kinase BUR1
MKLDWRKRINAIDALKHPYFGNDPKPARPGDIPRFEDSHELDRRKFRGQKAALPPAPAGGTVGMGPSGGWAGGGGPTTNGPWPNGVGPSGRRAPGGWPGGAGATGYGPGEGPPQLSHDSRVPSQRGFIRGGHGGPPDHRPPWSRGVQHDGRHPPPPPVSQTWGGGGLDGGRDRSYRAPSGSTGGRMDSYIPSYSSGNEAARVRDDITRRDDKYDRSRGGGDRREYGVRNSGRDRSRSPGRGMDRDRATHRDRDRDLYRR